jgi:N-acetyl-gamma-glutamyl-phosphate reductase
VRVTPPSSASAPAELDPQVHNGTNDMSLGVAFNERSGQIVLSAVLDNLGKGAAGAAVQNLRLMTGFDRGPTGVWSLGTRPASVLPRALSC